MRRFFFTPALLIALLILPAYLRGSDLAPAQPVIPARQFSLKDFGAVADGKTSNTDAFRRAVAAVDAAGGGTLLVPAGSYLTGPFDLCSCIDLRISAGAVISFSPAFADDAVSAEKYRPLLLAKHVHDVKISGSGTIYGHGEAWWPEALRFKAAARARHETHDTSPRPRMVFFDHCQRVCVEGVTLTHAPVFNLVPSSCEDVTIDRVTILNPADSPNTDGIDPSVSNRVLIENCTIDTGDDCIAVKAGVQPDGPMHDLLITDCTFLHGHGCSVGSETSGGLRNMIVRRCTFDGTETGVRFKSDRHRGGLVENIVYADLTMKHVGQAITISSYYMGATADVAGGRDTPQPVTRTTPQWRNIVIRNLTAVDCLKGAGTIFGLPEMPATGILLDHVTIEAPKGLRLENVANSTLRAVTIRTGTGPSILTDSTDQGIEFHQ